MFPRPHFCCRIVVIFVTLVSLLTSLSILLTRHLRPSLIIRDLGYLTRPLWDNPGEQPKIIIPHFDASNNDTVEDLCRLHGWIPIMPNTTITVIDAVIFSIELDILEIRIRELWDVVDIFLVMEADRTFVGRPKQLYLTENLYRFSWASMKLRHVPLLDTLKAHPAKEFDNEMQMRISMSKAVEALAPKDGSLIIVSDVDEVPFKNTIKLLKSCTGYPTNELHLQMKNYLYSFEFRPATTNWKPHVTLFKHKNFNYHHGKRKSNHTLANAGWHCSFCFRYLSDFLFKMTSYSHHSRVTGEHLLRRENIQKKICEGADLFDMLPEAYSYKELIAAMRNVPRTSSTAGIPETVLRYKNKFSFLLPGGCVREYSKVKYVE
ncbi:uncharacterized protein LOC110848618 isoform X1 [Folsomia candida]|uniref:uncharacterized protein LOC110848618 isoform X1 n=1 Tax=Folsomia candida TaxID=158441 RepID=UPI001604DEA3|nr:uncharacterized protein LOC110848618 isoform X1 [Folsomia candida]